jgi:ribosomal protein S18 acetylase RimI-like enzyme
MAKGTPQLVATYGERVVGWCDVNPVQRPTMRHSGVLGIGPLPQYRGRDLGEKLMLMTLEAAHTFGFTRVELSVRHDNARALGLYCKVGFEIEGRKRHAVLVMASITTL